MAIRKNLILLISLLILSLALALSVQAKRGGDDEDDYATEPQDEFAVPAEINAVATAVSNHGRSLATISNQVNEMVSKFQTMDGDIGKVDKKNIDQDKVLKDSQLRLQTLEDRISILTQQMQELKTEGLLKPATTQRLEEFKTYSRALEYVNAKNYTKAVSELTAFQETHKKSPFSDYAQYWIGESYYLQNDYEMSITEFQKLLAKNTQSPKAPGALYKQGLAFFYLQSFEDSRTFFEKVIRTYPQSIEAVQSSSQISRINNILDFRKQEEIERKAVEESL
jgi:tol-pal system protein YbgF